MLKPFSDRLHSILFAAIGLMLVVFWHTSCKKAAPPVTDTDRIAEATISTVKIKTPKIGFMLNYMTKPSWRNVSFIDSVKKLGLEIIRFPGGTESQYFDWQSGRSIAASNWGQGGLQNHNYIGTVPHVSYPLTELKYFYEKTGVKPIFCLNLLTRDLNNQLLMLTTARSLGIPVEYIELGNELFFTDADFISKYPTPDDYVTDIKNNWIPAIQAVFPTAKIAVIGSYNFTTDLNGNPVSPRISNWNSKIFSQISSNQAITFHYYIPPNTTTLSSPKILEALAAPFRHWQVLKQNTISNVPAGMDVYVTEYNLTDGNQTNYSIASSWTHALYTSTMFFLLLEEPAIKMILNHQITGSPAFASLTSYTPYGDTLTNNLSAEGNAMRILHNTVIGSDTCYKLTFLNNPLLTFLNINYNGLHGFVIQKASAKKILLLNLSGFSINTKLNNISRAQLKYECITCINPLQKNIQTNQLNISKGVTRDSVRIPSYSLTLLAE